MNVIFIIPTGVGAPIGGHAGDATPAAHLIAAVCDTLILHPNVLNASDIMEIPSNALYVTGTTIDDLLSGYVGLEEVSSNRIAVLVNKPVSNEIVNLVSAARAILGVEAFIVELPEPLRMIADFDQGGAASGTIIGALEASNRIQEIGNYDAVAIFTEIEMPKEVALQYVSNKGVNPWGGVEAKLTRLLTDILKVPCAHAPSGHTLGEDWSEIVDPCMAAEMISQTYGFCVLKGLHKAPEITDGRSGLVLNDIDVMISPDHLFGYPHLKCIEQDIPIIYVEENAPVVQNLQGSESDGSKLVASTYMEAVGMLVAMELGISFGSLKRPIAPTQVF